MDIVLENIIVGKADTTANWTSDATVYSLGFMMISSDATYSGTNVKKLKIANGVDAWADIDFVPVAETLAQILLKDNKTGGETIHSDDEYSVLKVLNNEIALLIDDGATGGANFLGDYTRAKMRFVEYATFKTGEINIDISRTLLQHTTLIDLNAPSVKKNGSEIVTTNDTRIVKSSFDVSFDGQGGVITVNANAIKRAVANGGTVTGFSLKGDVSGSIEIDMKKNGVSMVGPGNKIDLVSQSSDTGSPTSWTSTTFVADDEIEFVVSSATTITKLWLTIKYDKTS